MSLALIRGLGAGRYAPGAYSDEFNDSSTFSGQWGQNYGDNTTINDSGVNSHTPFCLHLQGQRYETAPAMPFTAIAKAQLLDWDKVAGVPQVGGVWINIAQAAPGPYQGFGSDVGTPGEMHLGSSKFNSSGAFTGNPHVVSQIFGSDAYTAPQVIKVVAHSSSNVDAYISFDDGLTWTTICTGYDPGFTINALGLESGGCRTDFAWIRVS